MKNLQDQTRRRSVTNLTKKFLIGCFLMITPVLVNAQKNYIYIKLTDASGQQIKGEATIKGFERSIEALTFASGGKNNTDLNFTMSISGASATLKKALNGGESLPNGLVVVQSPNGTYVPVTNYTITMEKIEVLDCSESMGCNNTLITNVTLRATRIGWTYYQTPRTGGTRTVSNKYGWDASTNAAWVNF